MYIYAYLRMCSCVLYIGLASYSSYNVSRHTVVYQWARKANDICTYICVITETPRLPISTSQIITLAINSYITTGLICIK